MQVGLISLQTMSGQTANPQSVVASHAIRLTVQQMCGGLCQVTAGPYPVRGLLCRCRSRMMPDGAKQVSQGLRV